MNITKILCASREYDNDALAELFRYRSAGANPDADAAEEAVTAAQKMLFGVILLGSVLVLVLSVRRRGGRPE